MANSLKTVDNIYKMELGEVIDQRDTRCWGTVIMAEDCTVTNSYINNLVIPESVKPKACMFNIIRKLHGGGEPFLTLEL